MAHNTDLYTRVSAVAQQIEAELKRLGGWQAEPLPREAFQNMGAFGSNTMSFPQWLQFVLLERVKEIVAEQGDFPAESQVGVYAMGEFEGAPDVIQLQNLLNEFDSLFSDGAYRKTVVGSGGQTLTFTTKPNASHPVSPASAEAATDTRGSVVDPPWHGTLEEKEKYWHEHGTGDAGVYYGLFGK